MGTVAEFYAEDHIGLLFGVKDSLHGHHSGTDVNGWRIRTPIPSLVRGRVVSRGYDPENLGNWVTVRAFEGKTSELRPERMSWCHLDSLEGVPELSALVGFDGYVGPLGTSGYSTGPHTHIMVSLTSDDPRSYAGLIDPLPYIVAARTRPAGGDITPIGDDMSAESEAKIDAIYDAIFTKNPTSLGTPAGVLALAGAIHSAVFTTDPTSRGTSAGVLAVLAKLEQTGSPASIDVPALAAALAPAVAAEIAKVFPNKPLSASETQQVAEAAVRAVLKGGVG
jgi:hypothetical protein